MNEQEDILNKVIRFGCIFQDSQGNSAYETRVATEQDCQRFPAPRQTSAINASSERDGFRNIANRRRDL